MGLIPPVNALIMLSRTKCVLLANSWPQWAKQQQRVTIWIGFKLKPHSPIFTLLVVIFFFYIFLIELLIVICDLKDGKEKEW